MTNRVRTTLLVSAIFLLAGIIACGGGVAPIPVVVEKEVIVEVPVEVIRVVTPTPLPVFAEPEFSDEVFSIRVSGDVVPQVTSQEITVRMLDGEPYCAWMNSSIEATKKARGFHRTGIDGMGIQIYLMACEEAESRIQDGEDNFFPHDYEISFGFDLSPRDVLGRDKTVEATGGYFNAGQDNVWEFDLADYLLDPERLDQESYVKEARNLVEQVLGIALNASVSGGS